MAAEKKQGYHEREDGSDSNYFSSVKAVDGSASSSPSPSPELEAFTMGKWKEVQIGGGRNFKYIKILGEGSFGRVFQVKDLKSELPVAMKVMKGTSYMFRDAAQAEVRILKLLETVDTEKKNLCVKLLDYFNVNEYSCIITELYGPNLSEFLEMNHFQEGFPMEQVRHIANQLCHAVKLLHDNNLIHTDVKPNNILLVSGEYETKVEKTSDTENGTTLDKSRQHNQTQRKVLKNADIRLIDFGSALFVWENSTALVTTRNYRAPEVIMGIGWSYPCDVWSIGCVLYQLYKGRKLFHATDKDKYENFHHLAQMQCVLGLMPSRMMRMSEYFQQRKLDYDWKSEKGQEILQNYKPLFTHMQNPDEDTKDLFDLIQKMLVYEPDNRITLQVAVKHPYFRKIPHHQRFKEDEEEKLS